MVCGISLYLLDIEPPIEAVTTVESGVIPDIPSYELINGGSLNS